VRHDTLLRKFKLKLFRKRLDLRCAGAGAKQKIIRQRADARNIDCCDILGLFAAKDCYRSVQ
jgi:hypothetical protein